MAGYWRTRLEQHTQDSYAGLLLSKFPEDLRVYEHLLWMQRPDVVIEVGTQYGASALWLRDRLDALARYGKAGEKKVISIDFDQELARDALRDTDERFHEQIDLLECDVRDPELARRVGERVPEDASCLVIEDSAHTYDATLAALRALARFVPPGGFFVVEDGCVDIEELRVSPDWPRGVLPAVRQWLEEDDGRRFEVRRDLELYGVTCHPAGFLQRRPRQST